jgi:hypothetical protein
MRTDAHITPADHRSELIAEAARMLARQLRSEPIAYIWPERHQILFRTTDGRTGNVEVFVNWDVAATESPASGSVTT